LRNRQVADLLVGLEEGLDRHRVGSLAHADDFAGDLEDPAMQRLIKVYGFQEIRDAIEGVVIDENGAEQGPAPLPDCSAPRDNAVPPDPWPKGRAFALRRSSFSVSAYDPVRHPVC
jgi:hypothetical protein